MSAETRRTQILDVAERLLVDTGNAGLTMRKIASGSGISLGNLQYHFAKREDVLLALLIRFLAPNEERLGDLPDNLPNDPVEALRQMFTDVLTIPDFDRCATIYKEIWAASNQSDEMRDALNAYYTGVEKFYRTLLSHVAEPGTSPEKIEHAAAAMLPLLEGHCVIKDVVNLPPEMIATNWARMVVTLLR